MFDGTYYLNNDGSRWIPPRKYRKAHVEMLGYSKVRLIEFAEAFGQFAALHLKINGKRYSGLTEDFPCECHNLPHLTNPTLQATIRKNWKESK